MLDWALHVPDPAQQTKPCSFTASIGCYASGTLKPDCPLPLNPQKLTSKALSPGGDVTDEDGPAGILHLGLPQGNVQSGDCVGEEAEGEYPLVHSAPSPGLRTPPPLPGGLLTFCREMEGLLPAC